MYNLFPVPVKMAHFLVKSKIRPGDVAIDATIGNGGDTLFLAELVGTQGRVYGFDIQEEAIKITQDKLAEAEYEKRVTLFMTGHETMAEYVMEGVDVIMFNLGYLPGGDHGITTKPNTTLRAIEQGLDLLKPGGLMTIVIYPGHEGGENEGAHVEEFIKQLPKRDFSCVKTSFLNRSQKSPYLVAVEKTIEGDAGNEI